MVSPLNLKRKLDDIYFVEDIPNKTRRIEKKEGEGQQFAPKSSGQGLRSLQRLSGDSLKPTSQKTLSPCRFSAEIANEKPVLAKRTVIIDIFCPRPDLLSKDNQVFDIIGPIDSIMDLVKSTNQAHRFYYCENAEHKERLKKEYEKYPQDVQATTLVDMENDEIPHSYLMNEMHVHLIINSHGDPETKSMAKCYDYKDTAEIINKVMQRFKINNLSSLEIFSCEMGVCKDYLSNLSKELLSIENKLSNVLVSSYNDCLNYSSGKYVCIRRKINGQYEFIEDEDPSKIPGFQNKDSILDLSTRL